MTLSLARYWALLIHYLRPQWPKALLLAFLLFGGIGLQLINPWLLRAFLDAALQGASLDHLALNASLFLVVALIAYLLMIGATAVGEDVGWAATTALRADLMAHCLHLDLAFHHAHTPGELIERVDGDVQTLAHLFSQLVLRLLGNLLLLVGVLVALAVVDWRASLVFSLVVGAAVALLLATRSLGVNAWQTFREANAALFGFIEERLTGLVDLQANGATASVIHRLQLLLRAAFRAELQVWRRTALPRNALSAFFNVGTALALGLGAWLVGEGVITVGTMFLIYVYVAVLFVPLYGISHEVENLREASASILRVDELFHTRTGILDGHVLLSPGPLALAFDRVSFGYQAETPVLHDVTFRLEAGKVLGLLGRTGSGKSTIARLALRLYSPQAGTITLGGSPLRDAHHEDLRQRVALVTQEVQLFQASLRDNLTLFDRSLPDDQIVTTLRDLGLGAWHDTLADGLDTMLAPAGSGLSAGEAQLLAFARVFLRDPGLVILDEAASRLDPLTEQRLQQAMDRLLTGRTAIIIAHRLTTVRRVDEIMVLDDGRVREHGPRAALAADPISLFARLLRTGWEEVLA